MSVNQLNRRTLNPTEHLLLWAFTISLILHLFAYGGFRLGNHYGWWHQDLMPAWLKSTKQKLAQLQKALPKPPPAAEREIPLTFVEVDPTTATPDASKDAKYYSSHNARAANKQATLESEDPNIAGTQDHTPKTEAAPRVRAIPLQPSRPKSAKPEENQPEAKARPKGGKPIGDLALAKPTEKPSEKPGENQAESDTGEAAQPVHHRPRTLIEAQAQQQALAGNKMKQTGGVKRHLSYDSLDVRATGFGEYDDQLIRAIQNKWYKILDDENFSYDHTGKVTVIFHLRFDGSVSDMKILQNEVGDVLGIACESAINDCAPYAPWPGDMRRLIGADYREIRFTFYYD